MKRPMIAAALISAILSLLLLKYSVTVLLPVGIICVALLMICIKDKKLRDFAAVFIVVIAVVLSGAYVTVAKINKVAELPTDTPIKITGVITEEYYNGGTARFTLKTDSENEIAPKNINISLYTKFAALNVGERVEIEAYLNSVDNKYKVQNYSKGIYATGTVAKVVNEIPTNNLTGLLARFRAWVTGVFYKYLTPDSAASVNALTVGDKFYLSGEFDALVRYSGVSHIMVVSGMHLTLICGAIFRCLEALKLRKHLAAMPAAVFVFLFMALCGFSMSVLRAGITYFVVLAAYLFMRKPDPINSLCVAVCIIIILNPYSIGSAALTLSVASTAGILIFSRPITAWLTRVLRLKHKAWISIIDGVSVTVAALIPTLPLSVYYFGAVSTVVVITNLLIGFAVNFALVVAAVALPFAAVGFLWPIANGLFVVCEFTTRYFSFIIEFFGRMPYAYIEVNKWFFIITYLAIITTFGIIKYRDKLYVGVKRCADCIRTGIKNKP